MHSLYNISYLDAQPIQYQQLSWWTAYTISATVLMNSLYNISNCLDEQPIQYQLSQCTAYTISMHGLHYLNAQPIQYQLSRCTACTISGSWCTTYRISATVSIHSLYNISNYLNTRPIQYQLSWCTAYTMSAILSIPMQPIQYQQLSWCTAYTISMHSLYNISNYLDAQPIQYQ